LTDFLGGGGQEKKEKKWCMQKYRKITILLNQGVGGNVPPCHPPPNDVPGSRVDSVNFYEFISIMLESIMMSGNISPRCTLSQKLWAGQGGVCGGRG